MGHSMNEGLIEFAQTPRQDNAQHFITLADLTLAAVIYIAAT